MGCGSNNIGRPAVPGCADTGWGCNYPLGMSPLELIGYDKNLYDLYRTNGGMGSGMIDAFPYDPVVSKGIFASQYQMSDAMAWAYLLTPDSQDNISVGDNLIVPVDTYTNNHAEPPYEKVMIGPGGEEYQSSYAASQINMQADMVAANKGNLPPFAQSFNMKPRHIPFAGDLTAHFREEESRLIDSGNQVAPRGSSPTIDPTPTPIGTGSSAPAPVQPSGPIATGPIGTGTAAPNPVVAPPPQQVIILQPPPIYSSSDNNPGIVIAPGTIGTSTMPTDTSSVGGGGGSAEDPGTGDQAAPGATAPCTTSYMPILVGALIGLTVGYLIADNNEKTGNHLLKYAGLGGVIGAIAGFVYVKHLCSPIPVLTKLGVKSKVGAPAPAPAATAPAPATA